LTTNPAMSLPCGTDSSGMPFGLQVIGRHRGDAQLLNCAQSMAEAFAAVTGLGRPIPDPELLDHPVPELQSLVTAPPPANLRRDDNR
jgi:amidase